MRSTTDRWRPLGRRGFSLLELIAAMLASTVLVASLAATVLIATQLLEAPPNDEARWHDRFIEDQIASDLRYTTGFDENYVNGFQLTRLDSPGNSQTITYQSSSDGLSRQVNSGPIIDLDPNPHNRQLLVDGYSAPAVPAAGAYARVRTISSAATDLAGSSIDVPVPPGCKVGDHIVLCVSAKPPATLTVQGTGWQTLQTASYGVNLAAVSRSYDAGWPSQIEVSAEPNCAMAAVMLAIDQADPMSPIDGSGASAGYAWSSIPNTHPSPSEFGTYESTDLNLQIFAANLDPWTDGGMGAAGFVDLAQVTAGQGSASLRHTIGVVARSGGSPDLTAPVRLLHQASGSWVQIAVRVEATP